MDGYPPPRRYMLDVGCGDRFLAVVLLVVREEGFICERNCVCVS